VGNIQSRDRRNFDGADAAPLNRNLPLVFMNTTNVITVTCPACGHEFPLSEAVLGSLREGVRKEFSADVSKREQSLEKKLSDLRTREEQLQKQAG
jgi:hypothetical protein